MTPDRRQAPWQIKFAYAFGIPAAIAVYLIYYQTTKMDRTITQLENNISILHDGIKEMNNTLMNNKQVIENSEKKYDRLLNMMVRVCANAAETNLDRNTCFEFAGTVGTIGFDKNYVKPPNERR